MRLPPHHASPENLLEVYSIYHLARLKGGTVGRTARPRPGGRGGRAGV
jgi:hypothetical protein